MATKKSTQAAPAASVNESTDQYTAADSLQLALALIEAIETEREQVIAVAIAGSVQATSDEAHIEKCLFDVITAHLESTQFFVRLHEHLNDLASHAGADIEVHS